MLGEMSQEGPDQLNILVVDDDEALRNLLAQMLSQQGHQVVLADSAEEALQLLVQWTFQLALLDHNLPGLQGLILGEYLRHSNPHMSIIMMTGSDDPRVERRTRDLKLEFLRKPFLLDDVLALVQAYSAAAERRARERLDRLREEFEPPVESFVSELSECFRVPSVPGRIESRVVDTVKRCLANLKSSARYTERERVMAFAGLLTAQVLGLNLPKAKSGKTLFEEYDQVMLERGRRTEFGVRPEV